MKKLSMLLVLGIMLTTSFVIAQNRGRGQNAYDRKYNLTTETNIQGTITAIEKQVYGKNNYAGVHLLIQTSDEKIPVVLGPEWYIEKQSITFNKGDKVEVEGSRVIVDGKASMIAKKVKKGKETLKLRDENGIALWSRSKQR